MGSFLPGLIFFIAVAFAIWAAVRNIQKRAERHLDSHGYYRDGYRELVHRRIAYKYVYDYPRKHRMRFGEYEIHHVDRNKTNNNPNNLEVLTKKQHRYKHGLWY